MTDGVRTDWSQRSASDVSVAHDSPSGGLTEDEAAQRLARVGPNEIDEQAGKSKLSILVAQLKGVLTYVLVAAALISGFLGDWIETVAIVAIIILNAVM
jgi:Ca2+-transporting ATPase